MNVFQCVTSIARDKCLIETVWYGLPRNRHLGRYFFSLNVEWSASVKEVSQNDFWTEVGGV